MKTYTISKLAKDFNLSRSTLLHYDKIGLLKSSHRTGANYRIYTQNEYQQLKQICALRSTGISLNKIKQIMNSDKNINAKILQKRLHQINDEINQLRIQQQFIITLLGDNTILNKTRVLNKSIWVDLLRAAGLDDEGMKKWHIAFEKSSPEAHQDFLEALGISPEEIKQIRDWSK